MSERPTFANQTYPPCRRDEITRLKAEIERLRAIINRALAFASQGASPECDEIFAETIREALALNRKPKNGHE